MKKWVLLLVSLLPLSGFAQLPIPITPDWLKSGDKSVGVLNNTHVTLTGDNYTILQKNIIAKSKGFKLLGIFSFRSASYTEAMSRLYSKAHIEEGHPQALANVVHESTSSNFILFSLPKVTISADLIEFTGEYLGEEGEAMRVRETEPRSPRAPQAHPRTPLPRPDMSRQ